MPSPCKETFHVFSLCLWLKNKFSETVNEKMSLNIVIEYHLTMLVQRNIHIFYCQSIYDSNKFSYFPS